MLQVSLNRTLGISHGSPGPLRTWLSPRVELGSGLFMLHDESPLPGRGNRASIHESDALPGLRQLSGLIHQCHVCTFVFGKWQRGVVGKTRTACWKAWNADCRWTASGTADSGPGS